MNFKNKIKFSNEFLFLCSCLILSVYAARPFSSGSSGSSSRGSGNLPSGSIGGLFRNTGVSSTNFNTGSKPLNTPFISISDAKKVLQTLSKPTSFISTAVIKPNSKSNAAIVRQPAYNPFYNPSSNTPTFSKSSSNTGNTQFRQSIANSVVNAIGRQPAYNLFFNLSSNTPHFSTSSFNTGNPQLTQPFPKTAMVPALHSPLTGLGAFNHPSILGLVSSNINMAILRQLEVFIVRRVIKKGFSTPTIHNHHYLKSLQAVKGFNKEQPHTAKIQWIIIGVVLSIIFTIAIYPLLLNCVKQFYTKVALSPGYSVHV